RSDELTFSSPTTATRSPPAIPPKVPVLATSELAKAIAIRARKASVTTMPIFDRKKLRKDWSMVRLFCSVQVGAWDQLGPVERSLYPGCGAAATVEAVALPK